MGLLDHTTSQQYYQDNDFGNYQFTPLKQIINQFIVGYVGENKLISKINRYDVVFHAKRALQELSFDVFKSCKSQEYDVPASLQMPLPQDYVNYTKISWVDGSGIKHRLYPTNCKTSNPNRYQQDSDGDFIFDKDGGLIKSGELLREGNFSGDVTNSFGNNDWILNTDHEATSEPVASTNVVLDPNQGHPPINNLTGNVLNKGFHWNNGKIIGYNLPPDSAFQQTNVPIYNGSKYTLTFTISGYTGGTYEFLLVNEEGHSQAGTAISANGTYTQTIDMSSATLRKDWEPQRLIFRNASSLTGGGYLIIDNISLVRVGDENESKTWNNYSSTTPSENKTADYEDDVYWPYEGERYGLDPQHAQTNGSYYIDCKSGKIHFSSNISGKTVVIDYISDTLGTDNEMVVHKFAEEAVYKWIAYAIVSTQINIPANIINRYKKEKFAEVRKAKLRLSNIKLEEITQTLRGKSKQIKH